MKAFRHALCAAAMGWGLAACGGDPLKAPLDALKAGDYPKAEAQLDALAQAKPSLKPLRAARFVLFRHLSVQGTPDRQPEYLTKAIGEYDALAQSLGLKPDYADMEGSLRSTPEGAALLAAARKPIYGE